jgi:uncharacterized protein YecE (DUF72 family)
MTNPPGEIRIGCSGWIYKHWRGSFYPQGVPQKRWLEFYAERFDTAEINASFYRLPTEAAVRGWATRAPEGFLFAWKASQYLTHSKKLKDAEPSLELIFRIMDGLGDKFGPVLFQLPPNLKLNLERLQSFLPLLPKQRRHTVEFRHPSWYAPEVFELLRAHDVSLCISDHKHAPAPWEATASFVYVRGHGPGGSYYGSYSDEELAAWADRIGRWRAAGRNVYAYFDNDIGTAAPADATRLKALLGL